MQSMADTSEKTPEVQLAPRIGDGDVDAPVEKVKKGGDHDVETASVGEEASKTYYSKLSVWLMILFSGLAIGSDG